MRWAERAPSWVLAALATLLLALSLPRIEPAAAKPAATKKKAKKKKRRCPTDMVSIWGGFCIDRYEAFVNEMVGKKGKKLKRHSPFKPLDKKKKYKALNRRGRMPQAYISQRQAAAACKNAGKRLCTSKEWIQACKGKKPTDWPYGKKHKPKRCNDSGVNMFNKLFGPADGGPAPQSAYTWENLNDDRLNRPKGTCAPAGRFKKCKNSFKLYDMVGNLHEWVADAGGTFRGGYYLDVTQHGDGCNYKTTAHDTKYHDYSTGFRCCK